MIRTYVDYFLGAPVKAEDNSLILNDTTGLASTGILRINGELMHYSAITASVTTNNPNAGILALDLRGIEFTERADHDVGGTVWYRITPSFPSADTWPGSRISFDAITDEATLGFWPIDSVNWVINGTGYVDNYFLVLPDGSAVAIGPTIIPTDISYAAQVTINPETGTPVVLQEAITVAAWNSLYIANDGYEKGLNLTPALVPATPTSAKVGSIWTITPNVAGGAGLQDWTQWVKVDAFLTDAKISKVEIDWTDGGPVEVFLLDGSSPDLGLPDFPSQEIHARFQHNYTSIGIHPTSIQVDIHDAGGLVATRFLPVGNVGFTSDYNIDHVQLERRIATVGDEAYLPKSIYTRDWQPLSPTGTITDEFLDPAKTYQFRVRYKQFSSDGREYPSGPAETITQFSLWSVAV